MKPVINEAVAAQALRGRLLQVIAAHQRGDIATALGGYREVLARDPRQFDALRLHAVALRSQGRLDEALEQFDRALAVRDNFAEVWFLRGETLAQLGRADAALASLERALGLRPDYAVAWNALGLQHHVQGRFEAALAAYERALASAPGVAAYWGNRALSLAALRRFDEALAHFERALACDSALVDLWVNRANALQDMGRSAAALESLDCALRLDPNLAEVWMGRAGPLRALGRLDEALQSCDRALALAPRLVPAWSHRGAALAELGRVDEAGASFERALELAPDDTLARFNLGVIRLTQGRLAEGWAGYEARAAVSGMVPAPEAPLWRPGVPVAGKTIALHCEQGLGDTIQFCRYATLLVQGGARVLLVVPPALHRLLDSLGPGVRVLTSGDPMPPFDLQCNLLSVTYCLGTTLESIPATVPYLEPPAQRVAHWRTRLAAEAQGTARPRLRIGLVCSGNAQHSNDRHRSLGLALLQPLLVQLAQQDCAWHLLQQELRPEDEALLAQLPLRDHRRELVDFCETAALIRCLDAVVSVDTSVAHLCGALGVPLYLLLAANRDWRWMLEREDSPWYPSARLLRQDRLGDWSVPLQRLHEALVAQAGQAAQVPPARESGTAALHAGAAPAVPATARSALAPPPGVAASLRDWRDDAMLDELLRAARAAPADPHAQFNLGLRYLALGRFDPGWDYYEWRVRVPRLYTPMPDGGAYWDGSQEIAGRTLLVCHEQGLGDAIQFCRYAPLLAAHGARVILGVPPPLARLMQGLDGVAEVFDGNGAVPPFDLKCLLLSAAQRLGTTASTLPSRTPYLTVPAQREQAWRDRLDLAAGGRRRKRLGLAVSGNPAHARDGQRSVALALFAPLRAALVDSDWEWHLLQKELRDTDAPEMARWSIADHRDQLSDLAETAALVRCMDVVVSVDTAVAHLAGALGVPLFVMLPADPDWRWMLEREDSPWYPGARLLRQGEEGDWTGVVERLRGLLVSFEPAADAAVGPDRAEAWLKNAPPALQRCSVRPPDLAAMLAAAAQAHRCGERIQAIAAYEEILAHDAALFDGQRLLGAALLQEGRIAEALPALERALALRNDVEEVWRLHADALARSGRHEEGLRSLERALALRDRQLAGGAPADPAGHAALYADHAKLCNDLGRLAQALDGIERAIQLAVSHAHFRFERGMLRLARGELPAAWEDFEARLQVPELATQPLPGIATWNGRDDIARRTLLLTCEQGLGDTIQFSRYAQALAARGARVVLGVQRPLREVLRAMPGVASVVSEGDALPAIDLQCPLLSVPHHLGTSLATIPAALPGLPAPPEQAAFWRQRLQAPGAAGKRRRLGLACSGNRAHVNDAQRSIPLARLAALAGLDVEWHLVQTELRPADEAELARLGIVDHRAALTDFAQTAGLIAALDAVVSADTAVAHLAGAMGVPLYLLLPVNADWRWMQERSDSPWYPTAQLLRQRRLGDWDDVVVRLLGLLHEA